VAWYGYGKDGRTTEAMLWKNGKSQRLKDKDADNRTAVKSVIVADLGTGK